MSNEVSIQASFETKIWSEIMINVFTCSILDSPSTYHYDDMDNGIYKSIVLEYTIKHLMKETSLGRRAAHNLVSRGQNIRA